MEKAPTSKETTTSEDAAVLLAALYAEDRSEHSDVPPVGTPEYRDLRERDRNRREQADVAIAELRARERVSAEPAFHARWLYNHGYLPEDALRAHELATEATKLGHSPARWLAAAAFDRWCMYAGRPQKYGTQFVPDGRAISVVGCGAIHH